MFTSWLHKVRVSQSLYRSVVCYSVVRVKGNINFVLWLFEQMFFLESNPSPISVDQYEPDYWTKQMGVTRGFEGVPSFSKWLKYFRARSLAEGGICRMKTHLRVV